jgi:hypothetical protein
MKMKMLKNGIVKEKPLKDWQNIVRHFI